MGNVVGNAAGNAVGNLVGNGWGNDALFSLNTWLRTIYCLQTIHKPACVILTLFQFFYSLVQLTSQMDERAHIDLSTLRMKQTWFA